MKKYITLIVLLFAITACQDTVTKDKLAGIDQSGLTFTTPEGWEVTDEEALDEETYFISVEKNGLDSSGIVNIISFEGRLDLDETVQINIDELKNNVIYIDATFDPIVDNTFGANDSKSSSYLFRVLGVKHQGIIHAFHGSNRTFFILKQEAIEDISENKAGFDVIEGSFLVE